MIKSISSLAIPARSIANRAALTPKSLVASSLAAMRLSLIPVRFSIHSSLVSTIFSRSLLLKMREGA